MAKEFPVTIHHNPSCGTSRNTLELIRRSGAEPTVHEYVKEGWSKTQLRDLFAHMGIGARDILRVRGTQAEALGLTRPGISEDKILDAMVADPILVERPIVETPKGVRLCRPAEGVLDLL